MKTQKKNIIAIGGCFFTTLLLHIYSIELVHVSIIIPIGLGIISLGMACFFLDAICKYIVRDQKDNQFYLDHAISHESELWLERYTELLNTQKASYTATKKSAEYQRKQFEDVLSKLESLEKNQENTLQKVLELQKKALEGQKKALNIEMNHSKENANKIMEILQEESKREVSSNQFDKLLSLEESNQKLFQDQLQRLVEIKDHLEVVENIISQGPAPQKVFIDDYYKEEQRSANEDELSLDSMIDGLAQDYLQEDNSDEESFNEDYLLKIASIGDQLSVEEAQSENIKDAENPYENEIKENASETSWIYEEPELEADVISDQVVLDQDILNQDVLNEIDSEQITSEQIITEEIVSEENPSDEIVPDEIILNEIVTEQKVIPLYEDPNKALTEDEIAKLFASFGQ